MKNPGNNRRWLVGCALSVVVLGAVFMSSLAQGQRSSSRPAWNDINNWALQTVDLPYTLDEIAKSTVQLGVINRLNGGGYEWKRSEIEATKKNKWLIAYIGVGEAAESEWYWPDLAKKDPKWLGEKDPNGHAAHAVYPLDQPEWVAIQKQFMDKLISAGFDGAFYDILDVYWNPGYPGGPSKENMARAVKLACQLSSYARSKAPGFKVLVNNAVNLIVDFPEYAACIDATVGESVWYYHNNNPKTENYTSYQIGLLGRNKALGKKVFTIDKATLPELVERVYRESRKLGFIPFATGNHDFFPATPR